MAGHVAPFCPLYFLVTAGLVFAAILHLQLQVCTMCSLALKCEFIHYYLEKTKKKKEVLDSKFDICWHLGISFRPYNVHKGCGSDSASTAFVSPVKNA